MALIQMFIDHFGKNCIKGILADRELLIVATTESLKQPLQHTGFAGKSNAFSAVLRGVDLTLRTRISRIKLELKNGLHCWPLHLHGLIVLANGNTKQ